MATRSKRDGARELAAAISDLNKIFTQSEIAERFNLKKWKVGKYKKYKKNRKPLPARKHRQIVEFYRKILNKREYHYKYDFRVSRGRIKPTREFVMARVRNLRQRVPRKKLAEKLGVFPSTITRWQEGQFKRIKTESRKRLSRVEKRFFKKSDGLFFVQQRGAKKPFKEYSYIQYRQNFYGTPGEFYDLVRTEVSDVHDHVMGQRGKIKGEEVEEFLKNIKDVSGTRKDVSMNNVRAFLKNNFSGKELEKYIKVSKKHARKKRKKK